MMREDAQRAGKADGFYGFTYNSQGYEGDELKAYEEGWCEGRAMIEASQESE